MRMFNPLTELNATEAVATAEEILEKRILEGSERKCRAKGNDRKIEMNNTNESQNRNWRRAE